MFEVRPLSSMLVGAPPEGRSRWGYSARCALTGRRRRDVLDKVVLINAAWGLGETVVQGNVDPNEYQVFYPLLSTPGLTPIVEKKRGEKAQKLIYDSG
jgi:hypothetical protein